MILLFVIVFWISLGLIEGFLFNNNTDIFIIYSTQFPDYHFWKLILYISYLVPLAVVFSDQLLLLLGLWIIGNFCFERVLDKITTGHWYKLQSSFSFAGITIPYPFWVQVFFLCIGIILVFI